MHLCNMSKVHADSTREPLNYMYFNLDFSASGDDSYIWYNILSCRFTYHRISNFITVTVDYNVILIVIMAYKYVYIVYFNYLKS